ncbi:MAG: FAD:protein FMN transferase [Oscillospiraceae bacterium]
MKRLLPFFLCVLLLTGCAPAEKPQSVTGFYFDTVISITTYGGTDALLTEALARCKDYENLLSKTRKQSDVWKINCANGARTPISDDTRAILETALHYGELSGGKFDVTIAPVSALWDFKAETPAVPDKKTLAKAAELVDYRAVDLDEEGVQLPAGCQIDLGGIAKGYITDQIAAFLRERGITSAYLNFGGNVLTIGTKPDGTPWTIGLQDPKGEAGEVIATVPATDLSVVTSGIYERGFTADGTYYHHILDPQTGYPIENNLAAVSILTANSMNADALSTTCFALGETEGMALIESLPEVEAVFITRDGTLQKSSGAQVTQQ